MNHALELVQHFLADRPTMLEHNSDPHSLLQLLHGEIQELEHALQGHNTPHYLEQEKHIATELADVLFFVLSLSHILRIDVDTELREKMARNMLKYAPSGYQGGSYHEQHARDREIWSKNHLDESFYSV